MRKKHTSERARARARTGGLAPFYRRPRFAAIFFALQLVRFRLRFGTISLSHIDFIHPAYLILLGGLETRAPSSYPRSSTWDLYEKRYERNDKEIKIEPGNAMTMIKKIVTMMIENYIKPIKRKCIKRRSCNKQRCVCNFVEEINHYSFVTL